MSGWIAADSLSQDASGVKTAEAVSA